MIVCPPLIVFCNLYGRDEEPANFLSAPAPDFFFSSGSGSLYFFRAAPAPRGQKTDSGLLVKFGKIFFSPQTSKVKCKKYKTSKIIVFLTIKTYYFTKRRVTNKSTISLCFLSSRRAEELANFLAAPAPEFFFKRLRLWLLFFFSSGSGSGSCFFFKWLRLQGVKSTRLRPAPAPQPWYGAFIKFQSLRLSFSMSCECCFRTTYCQHGCILFCLPSPLRGGAKYAQITRWGKNAYFIMRGVPHHYN